MMNYACDVDLYALWARMLTGADLTGFTFERPYHAAHIARRRQHRYALSHEQVIAALGPSLLVYRELPPAISAAMGDQVYLARHTEQAALLQLIEKVQQRA